MNYRLSISKDEINKLPMYRFDGEIILVESKTDALAAVEAIKNEPILGFDTETKAAFKKGESYKVSMLQLATDTHAYLFRLNKCTLLDEIVEILEDPMIVKAGVAIDDDIKALKKLNHFKENNFIDLARIAQEKKILNFGLRALTAIFLSKRLSKKAKISNWQRKELTQTQIDYAASDAVVGYLIYKLISKD